MCSPKRGYGKPAAEDVASGAESSTQSMKEKKEALDEGTAVKFTNTVAFAPGAEGGREGTATQLGAAGAQGA